jgi:DNA-binding transcriptional ArsR family regulator
MRLEPATSDPLSSTFAALADPTRRAILARLIEGHASVTELAEPFEMSLPAVSKHLKVLERAGLISRGREAQWRPCRLTANPLKDVSDWVEHYRRFWAQSLDRLDDYLRDLQAKTSMESSTTTIECNSSTAPKPNKHSKERPHDRD